MLYRAFLLVAVLFVAYTNGANDNFKGVATLFGSGTSGYRGALAWGTLTTFTGSVTALILSEKLVSRFSGKGLVPDALVGSPEFVGAVALAAALTVFLATMLSLPISTTLALTGALACFVRLALWNRHRDPGSPVEDDRHGAPSVGHHATHGGDPGSDRCKGFVDRTNVNDWRSASP